jgi:chromosome segregation ATPase
MAKPLWEIKQELMKEIRDISLDKNRLSAEKSVLEQDTKELYEVLQEGRKQKESLQKAIKALEQEAEEVKTGFESFVDEVREGMRHAHDMAQYASEIVKKASDVISSMLGNITELEAEKQSVEAEIVVRREMTKQKLKDLDIYADRLTKAYEMIMPDQKIVIGSDIEQEIDTSKIVI